MRSSSERSPGVKSNARPEWKCVSEATITIAVLSSATIHSTVVIAPTAATRR